MKPLTNLHKYGETGSAGPDKKILKMKTKKLYLSFTCYLILAAFTGIISVGISVRAVAQHQKTVISQSDKTQSPEFNFLLEEENDAEHFAQSNFLLQPWFQIGALAPTLTGTAFFNGAHTDHAPEIPGLALFIRFRTLRL
jgi:hypothetical protein